ncbi:MAG TPA: type II toxin-antitoxin system PemK/MazF family toxin [Candidatus Paceibacterota bacterium]
MYKKGTVVLVPFPFTDLSGSKVRPAVIISSGIKGDDVVVAFVSSQDNLEKDPFSISLEQSIINGLKTRSIIRCSKLATLDKKIILGELGVLEPANIKLLNKKLKQLFDL